MSQAVILNQFGNPTDVLKCGSREDREPGPGEVSVRMLASPVNPSDLLVVRGQYGVLPELPAVPGLEGVGVVEATGGGLRGWSMRGRRVAVINPRGGAWAERQVVSANQVIPLSSKLSLEQAATFFVNPATACILVRHVLRIPKEAWLIQTAAASTLGRMIIRLGRHWGFKTLNIVRRQEQVAELQALGADVVLVQPRLEGMDAAPHLLAELVQACRQHTDGALYALDAVGGPLGSALVQCLRPGGRLVVYGTLSNLPLSIPPRDLMMCGGRVEGFWLGQWMSQQSLWFKLRLVRQLTRLILDGTLGVEAFRHYSLAEVRTAVAAAEEPGRVGKILFRM